MVLQEVQVNSSQSRGFYLISVDLYSSPFTKLTRAFWFMCWLIFYYCSPSLLCCFIRLVYLPPTQSTCKFRLAWKRCHYAVWTYISISLISLCYSMYNAHVYIVLQWATPSSSMWKSSWMPPWLGTGQFILYIEISFWCHRKRNLLTVRREAVRCWLMCKQKLIILVQPIKQWETDFSIGYRDHTVYSLVSWSTTPLTNVFRVICSGICWKQTSRTLQTSCEYQLFKR